MKRCPAAFFLALFLAALAPTLALAQAAPPSAVSLDVQRLAPQLVAFAGSEANFQSLVNGLAGGFPVTLVTPTADGFTQTATFTPSGTLSSQQIAQTLEAARQQLISRGIANPTAQQLGVTLAGGTLPTAIGNQQVTGLVPVVASAAAPASASAGSSSAGPAAANASGLSVQIAPTVPAATASTGSSAPLQFTSDTPRLGNVSDSPNPAVSTVPSTAGTTGAASSPAAAGMTGTSPAPGGNGPPSPAAVLQNRR